jgi:transcriptional regulator with XRE-family HTH domain
MFAFQFMIMLEPEDRGNLEFFGKRVRILREERGWSQSDLAAKAGLNTVSGIELGEADLEFDALMKLAKAFGMSVGELLQGV